MCPCAPPPPVQVRTVSAKALGAMVKGMGESCFDDLLPWLMETLASEQSSVDRSGAAQGELCRGATSHSGNRGAMRRDAGPYNRETLKTFLKTTGRVPACSSCVLFRCVGIPSKVYKPSEMPHIAP